MFANLFDSVYSLTVRWEPTRHFRLEHGYRDDLATFLQMGLPGHIIQTEHSGSRSDIGVDRAVGIETKANLDTKPEADRLQGQVNNHLKEYGQGVIVVLCGNTAEQKFQYLRAWEASLRPPFPALNQKRVRLVLKR